MVEVLPANGVPKAVVITVPGWDSVVADYVSLTRELVSQGYAVYGFENRSFVYGPKESRGRPHGWEPWVRDLRAFSRWVRSLHPGLPVVWHGSSFGAVEAIAATAGAETMDAPDGIIVHCPGFAFMFEKASLLRSLLYGSIQWLQIPHIAMMDRLRVPISTDAEWHLRWMHSEDRLREGYLVRFLICAANMGIRARQAARTMRLPVLAMWGGADRLCLGGKASLKGAYDRFMRDELAPGYNTPCYWPEGGHLLIEGSTKDAAVQCVLEWMEKRTEEPGKATISPRSDFRPE